jgi:putative FmdB family regulatory protein
MPMYDYRCTACSARFERWQKFSDEPIRVCPECGGPAQRVIHAPVINFKGAGFYSTDSKGGASSSEAASPAPAAESSSEAAPAAKSETAPAAKSETKPATATSESGSSAAKPAAAPAAN